MPNNRLPLRLIIFAVLAIVAVVLIALAVSTLNSALELYERVSSMPLWLRLPLGLVLVLVVATLAVLAWRLWRTPASRQRNATRSAPSRDQVDEQLQQLRQRAVETSALQQELEELDRRRLSGDCHVAVFGEISTGKSSLIRALASQSAPDIDVLGGTTRLVQQFHGVLPDGRELILADVPGSSEVAGGSREALARDEALRAHAVLYVCASDLTRAQDAEITWLTGFGKPLILVLNKIDQLDAAQRQALQS
ncbi:MAG: GTPase, partial [Dokdonella sp.]